MSLAPSRQDSGRLDQKVALVTSSSPGICARTARQFASEGAKVMVCGRNANQGLATVKQIRREGGRATFVLADVATLSDVQAVIDETIATYGRLDILFNNVSNRYLQDGPLHSVSESIWDRVIEPLLKGTFFCCQYALPFLQQGESGTIINLIEKLPEADDRTVSAVCQGGVLALTSAIAQQFATSAVTANVIWATSSTAQAAESYSSHFLGASLLSSQLLTGPLLNADGVSIEDSHLFTDIAEAVMYLACHGRTLHGSALWVNTADTTAVTGGF